MKFAISILVVLMIALTACSQAPGDQPKDAGHVEAKSGAAKQQDGTSGKTDAEKVSEMLAHWNYSDSKDDLTDKVSHLAVRFSIDTVNFDFPYQGDQHAAIAIGRRQGESPVVQFFIERGQIQCDLDQCNLRIRFDDQPAENWKAIRSPDQRSNLIFLADADRFLTKLSSSKRLLIGVGVYQNGFPTFHFDVSGLDTSRLGTF